MAKGIYVSATTPGSGKSLIALGLADTLHRHADRIGFFKPVVNGHDAASDPMVVLMKSRFNLDDERCRAAAITLLDRYADQYIRYPNADNVLGPSRPFFSTYLESIWLLQICIATDLLGDADALLEIVKPFADPRVGLVQAPQDHRDGDRSLMHYIMNGEYAGFFDIGMVQRNEVNAIIVHGTMCLIRRAALNSAGGWASDTIVVAYARNFDRSGFLASASLLHASTIFTSVS